MNRANHSRQAGFSLVVVMVLLIVMSLLGIAVLRSSAMQERMSGSLRDRSLAYQAAERTMAFALGQLGQTPTLSNPNNETWETLIPNDTHCNQLGICCIEHNTATRGLADPCVTNTLSAGVWQAGPTLGGSDAAVPDIPTEYWIEYLGTGPADMGSCQVVEVNGPGPACFRPIYRISARTTAGIGRAEVVLQSNILHKMPQL